MHVSMAPAWLLLCVAASAILAAHARHDTPNFNGADQTSTEQHTDVAGLAFNSRSLSAAAACGGTGQKCCAGKTPCTAKQAGCVSGTCRLPCGGRNMLCCKGFNGKLDFSGSSGSRSCNRVKGLVCYKGYCKLCGKLGRPCCSDGLSCTEAGTTCNTKTSLCVKCGGLNQRCCAQSGPPCNNMTTRNCVKVSATSSKCVPKCGARGQRCCSLFGAIVPCNKKGDKCSKGKCVAPPCGGTGQRCCSKVPCKTAGDTCVKQKCVPKPPPQCGGTGQSCCSGAPSVPPCKVLGNKCINAKCVGPCGSLNQRCCDAAESDLDLSIEPFGGCRAALKCSTGTNGDICKPCGAKGQPCCVASRFTFCGPDLLCKAGTGVCEACGGTGQACCADTAAPCRVPKSQCVSSVCKDPCGGEDMRCCQGFEGVLDFSGSSGSRACNRAQGLACYKSRCKKCGSLGKPCCTDSGVGCSDSVSTCNQASQLCEACGELGQKCCVGAAPCIQMPQHKCSTTNPSDGVCVTAS